ncbi:MAG: ATP-binding protein [Cyclobacteriaceae bacterium]|nr:ATP-binding protein [Cyclobacteriaceae bacterium]
MKNKLQISCNRQNLKNVREFIARSLDGTKLSGVEINSLVLAVDEVCANVIIHSNKCNENEKLEVFTELKENEVIFEVIDNGRGYDLRKHEAPNLKEIVKSKRKGGVGLLLVQKIMDEIDFIPYNKGHIIRLIKHI